MSVNFYLRGYGYSLWLIVGISFILLLPLVIALQFLLLRYLILRTIDSVIFVILRHFLYLLNKWYLEGNYD